MYAALNSIFHNLEFISQKVHFLDAKIGAANRKTTGKKHKSFFPFAIVTPTAGSKDEREGRFQHSR